MDKAPTGNNILNRKCTPMIEGVKVYLGYSILSTKELRMNG